MKHCIEIPSTTTQVGPPKAQVNYVSVVHVDDRQKKTVITTAD